MERSGPRAERGPHPDDPGVAVAASIRSLRQAARVFLRFGSPKVLAAGVGASVAIRLGAAVAGLAPFGWGDLVAVVVVTALVPWVEWSIHRTVLHAEPGRRRARSRGRLLDPAIGHRDHHDNPASVNWVVLTTPGSALFLPINVAVASLVVGLAVTVLGWPATGPMLTAVVGAAAALAHYEWSHFLFHTAYRPRTGRYRRLKANHLRHHWRDDGAWLGVTSNLADRVMRTDRVS